MSSAYYRSLKREKEKELSNYKKRRSQIESIKKDVANDFEGNASDINRQYQKVAQNIKSGIVISDGANNADDAWSIREGGLGDSNVGECHVYLATELNRINKKISELEAEIQRLKSKIHQEEARERKEREEALKKLLGVE